MENGNTTLTELGSSFGSSNETLNKRDTECDVLNHLNSLIVLLNVDHPRVSSLLHISSNVYPSLFAKIFGYTPIDLIDTPKTAEDEVHNIQCVIDTLSLDVLGVSLSHITGEDILARKPLPISHFLEIISKFGNVADLQISHSSVSIPVSASSSSPVSQSNASHQEHFCPVCEYGLAKAGKTLTEEAAVGSDSSVPCSCSILLRSHPGKENTSVGSGPPANNSKSETSRSGSSDLSGRERRRQNTQRVESLDIDDSPHSRKKPGKETSFNEKLAQRLMQNVEHLNRQSEQFLTRQQALREVQTSMDETYQSFFHRRPRRKPSTPAKETSVLLPRYLKRRRTTSKSQPTSNKKQKVQATTNIKSISGGILEEIKSDVPGVEFTQEGLNVLRKKHQNQVRLLSSRLSSLQKKITRSEKMLQENIAKQEKLVQIEQRDLKSQERLKNTKALRNERLKTRGAIRDVAIQRARLKRYFDRYHVEHQRKMSSHQAKAEVLLQDLYSQRLSLQKQKVIDINKDLKEQEKEEAERLGNRMALVQNLYLGRAELLRKKAEQEEMEKQSQIKSQQEVLEKTRRAILRQIENEVKEIQENLEQQDDFHFVERDADRLRSRWSRPS